LCHLPSLNFFFVACSNNNDGFKEKFAAGPLREKMTILHELQPVIRNRQEVKRENYNIHVIDDDYLLNELVEHRLKKSGFTLHSAASGEAFLENIDDIQDNALLVIDYMLPDMDGLELVQELTRMGKDFPFIVATGYGDEKLAVELMKAGALDYIIKDCNYLSFLPDVLDRVIGYLDTEASLQRTTSKLKDNDLRFSHLFENIPDAVFTANSSGDLTEFNSAFVQLLGMEEEKLHGRNLSSLIASDVQYLTLISKLGEQKNLKDYELNLTKGDGEVIHCLLSALLLSGGRGFQGIIRDITSRKRVVEELKDSKNLLENQNSELLEMATALRTLHDSITNDLRAPLWRIDGFCQALVDQFQDKIDDKGREFIAQIHRDSKRVTQFVNDAMNLSRISDAKVQRSKIDLSNLVRAVLSELENTAENSNFEATVQEGLYVYADKPLVSVMLRVLINNAIDLLRINPEGNLSFYNDDRYANSFCICLQGITNLAGEGEQPFLPLYEPGHSRDPKFSGVDLLSARRIVNLHQGRIWKELENEDVYKVLFTLTDEYLAP
jgi:PAS domain S-box-containing protein